MAKILRAVDWYVHLAMIVSIALGIAAFILPPTAVVDKSVLYLIAELTGAAALFTFLGKLPEYIEKGANVKFQRGNTIIEAGPKRKRHHQLDDEPETEETEQEPFNEDEI